MTKDEAMEIITFSPQYLELMEALEDAKEKLTTHALDFPVPVRERRRCSVATARLSENGGPEVT